MWLFRICYFLYNFCIKSCFSENVTNSHFLISFVIFIELRYSKLRLLLQQTDIPNFYTIRLQNTGIWVYFMDNHYYYYVLSILLWREGFVECVPVFHAVLYIHTVQLYPHQPKSRPGTLNWIGVFNGLKIKSKIFVKTTLALFLILQKRYFSKSVLFVVAIFNY